MIAGAHDHPLVDQAPALAGEVADGRLTVIPGAYHSPQLTHVGPWRAAVGAHLAWVRRGMSDALSDAADPPPQTRSRRAGRPRCRHPTTRRRDVGVGRQGHVGHGRLRPIAHRGDIREAWEASIAAGVVLFDTAEVYGGGESERIIGRLLAADPGVRNRVVIATKFMPSPWKVNVRAALLSAARRSRERLGLDVIDLYQIQGPSRCVPTTRWPRRWPRRTPRASCVRSACRTTRPRRPAPSTPPCTSAASGWPATRSSSPSCGPCRSASAHQHLPGARGRASGLFADRAGAPDGQVLGGEPAAQGRSFSAHPMAEVDTIVALLRRIGEPTATAPPARWRWRGSSRRGGAHPRRQEREQAEQNEGPGLAPDRRERTFSHGLALRHPGISAAHLAARLRPAVPSVR